MSTSAKRVPRAAQVAVMRSSAAVVRTALGVTIALLAIAILFRWDREFKSLEDAPSRVLLSLLGLAVGAWMLRILVAGAGRMRRTVAFGACAILVSQLCYHGLVWAGWKPLTFVWRAWWLSLVVSVVTTHLVWLHFAGEGQQTLRRIAVTGALLAGAMWSLVCLGQTPLPDLPGWYLLTAGAMSGVSVATSLVVWMRMRWRRGWRFSIWTKVGAATLAQTAVIALAFYLGRVTSPRTADVEQFPSMLASMSPREIDEQLTSDLRRLMTMRDGLDELTARSIAEGDAIQAKRVAENRTYFLPTEEDQIRARFTSYLAYRAGLLRLAATYAGYAGVSDPALRARCFLVGYTAGAGVYESSLRLVRAYSQQAATRQKLNEPDIATGLPAGTFDRIEEAATAERNLVLLESGGRYFDDNTDRWSRAGVLPESDLSWVGDRVNRSRGYIRDNAFGSLDVNRSRIEQVLRRVKGDAYEPYYAAQALVSTWIGDTRLVARAPFISPAQVARVRKQLRPGDIFLERRNWFASNAFLPGFWPHAALYTGGIDDLAALGLVRKDERGKWTSDDPGIRDRLGEFLKPAHDGAPHTIIESVSEGVVFNSAEESMSADYVAVLRPRLSDEQKARAIARAFSHQGKPYDFEFDFFSADKLVCTELVYRSYEGLVRFDLVRVMGRDTLPAIEIVKKFATERTRPEAELDFVLFLDVPAGAKVAEFGSEEAFCASRSRPKGFNK